MATNISYNFLIALLMNIVFLKLYVTGFWKTDQNVTLDLLYFIGPANSYTHTLPFIVALPGLAYTGLLFKGSFANYVNSQLRKWGPWRALHRKHGSEIYPSGSETSLRPSTLL